MVSLVLAWEWSFLFTWLLLTDSGCLQLLATPPDAGVPPIVSMAEMLWVKCSVFFLDATCWNSYLHPTHPYKFP